MTFLWGVGWQKFFSPEFVSLARPRRTLQNPKKVFVRVKFVFLRRFNQTVDHGAGLRATGRIGKEPVLPARYYCLMCVYARLGLTVTVETHFDIICNQVLRNAEV